MTSHLPLLAANGASSASASQGESLRGGPPPGAPGGGQAFGNILRSLPDRAAGAGPQASGSGRSSEEDEGGRGLPLQGGKALPPSSSHDPAGHISPLGTSSRRGGSVPQSLRVELEQALADAKTGHGQALSPEMVDMLRALLSGGRPDDKTPAAPGAGGGAGQSGAAGAGSRGGDALTELFADMERQAGGSSATVQGSQPSSSPSPAQWLQDLNGQGPDTPDTLRRALAAWAANGGQDGPQTGLPNGNRADLEAASIVAALRQLLQQSGAGGQPGSQQGLTAGPQDGGTSAANGDVQGLMAQMLSQQLAPNELDAPGQRPAADHKGVQGSSGASSGASNQPLFSTAIVHGVPPGQSPGGSPPALSMPQPFNQRAWDHALGQNVTWMAQHNVQVASLRLNPPHLGPLQIQVSVDHDQASVSFIVHHAVVRDAVETALPRLREMFSEGGVNLANVNVSDNSASGQGTGGSEPGNGEPQGSNTLGLDGGPGAPSAPGAAMPLPLGLVDYFV